jgi:hypothetical protein
MLFSTADKEGEIIVLKLFENGEQRGKSVDQRLAEASKWRCVTLCNFLFWGGDSLREFTYK